MSISDEDKAAIFSRIGQLEGEQKNEASHMINNEHNHHSSSNDGGAKAFASVLVIISIIGGMAAIITPIRQQMDFMSTKVDKLIEHASDGHPMRVEKEQRDIREDFIEHEKITIEIYKRLNELEQKVAVLKEQMTSGIQDRYYKRDAEKDHALRQAELKSLTVEVQYLKELIRNVNIPSNSN